MTSVAVSLTGAYFDFLADERDLQRIILREVMSSPGGAPEILARHLGPIRTLVRDVLRLSAEQIQTAISLFGAVAGYFLYEPALGTLLGQDLRAPEQLAIRRAHLVALAERLTVDGRGEEPEGA